VDALEFSASMDSRGRVTIPADLREKLKLDSNEKVDISIKSPDTYRKEVESFSEAKRILSCFEDVESFSFEEGVLEVVFE
jgi:AbrB family looped-hinge helix DNA binding protein